MVGREDLINAIALNSSMVNGARIVGPAVAGLLVAAVGEGWCFGGLVCIVAAALFALRLPVLRVEARRLIIAQELAGGEPPPHMTGPIADVPARAES